MLSTLLTAAATVAAMRTPAVAPWPPPCAPAPAEAAEEGEPAALLGDPGPLLVDPAPDDMGAVDELQRVADRVRTELEDIRDLRFEDSMRVDFADRDWISNAVRERWEELRPAERVAREERTAKFLGLLPHDASLREEELRLLEQTASFYDLEERRLYLRGSSHVSPFIVAAGLARALHEQHYDELTSIDPAAETTDSRWTREAVLRGSSLSLVVHWAFEHLERLPVHELGVVQRSRSVLDDSPPYVWRPLLALASRGESFLRRSTRQGWISPPRRADLERAARHVPLSSEQLLHPDKYWTSAGLDEPESLRFEAYDLPPDWALVHQDTLGEVALSVLVEPFDDRRGVEPSFFAPDPDLSNGLTAGWGGDRVVLLEGASGSIVHLVSSWDTDGDASEFAAALDDQQVDLRDNLALLTERDEASGARMEIRPDRRVELTVWTGLDAGDVDRVLAGLRLVRRDS